MNVCLPLMATLASLFALAGGLALCSSPALAAFRHSYISQLTEAGKPLKPFSEEVCGVTVDPKSQDVYVTDPGRDAIDIFDSAGKYLSKISGKSTPHKSFSKHACSTAVNDTSGDLYVADSGSGEEEVAPVVYVFSPEGKWLSTMTGSNTPAESFGEEGGSVHVAVNQASGDIYVADQEHGVVDRFNSEGEYISQLEGLGSPEGLAIDSSGDVYVADAGKGVVDVLNSKDEPVREITGAEVPGGSLGTPVDVALDTAGHVYVADESGRVVDEFDAAGAYLDQTTGAETPSGSLGDPTAVAVNAAGDLYVTGPTAFKEELRGHPAVVDIFGAAVVVPDVGTGQASDLSASAATLSGAVNPDGVPVTSCSFEYGTSASYGQSAPCEPAPGGGEAPVPVSAHLSGLKPLTVYHFRLVAANANGAEHGTDATFRTFGPPTVDSQSVSGVTSAAATLAAQINPDGYDTTYRFEYGPSTSYGTSLPIPDADIGSAVGDVAVSVGLHSLNPGTLYHFRVVAVNAQGTVPGADHSFMTQGIGGGLVLPDGRGWEMVSPPNKQGAGIEAISHEGGLIQASEDGSAISYVAGSPTEAEPQGNRSGEWTQVLSRRGSKQWESQDIAAPHDAATGLQIGNVSEYKFFSSDLSLGLVEPKGATPLSPEATERTIYLRNDNTCERPPRTCYLPLVTAANVPPGTKFGSSAEEIAFEGEGHDLHFEGATPDLSHVVLSSTEALTANAVKDGVMRSLYEWTGGMLQLLSVLPNGKPATAEAEPSQLGYNGLVVRHAISNDGSRIFWEAGKHLYMRDTTKAETIQLDAVQGGSGEGNANQQFQTASEDGSKVFFTDSQALTTGATTGQESADLYECEVIEAEGKPACKLTDLTTEVKNAGEHADVQGILPGASEDGSYVYFVATGALAVGAEQGNDNLYVRHDGATTFIAALSGEDDPDWGAGGGLAYLTSRASPDGRFLAFMSDRSLTGYDNIDANSPPGEPRADEEVFLYDASMNRLVCASCDPTGARPVGIFDPRKQPGPLVDRRDAWELHWLAGSVPAWTNGKESDKALYQSRYLSDSGRLFFDSPDALVPQDTNGKEDVYQYEPTGIGGCTSASATFSERSGGCVGLISSGTSPEESAFLDASASGSDVFFLTASALTSQDVDTAFDVYDAHECTAASPCLTPPAPPPPPCASSESCSPAPPPAPSIFGASGSATFSGAGNLAPPPTPIAKPRPKPLTRAQQLARALKACRKKPKTKRKRASCEAQARRRYGTKAKAKKPKAKKSASAGNRRTGAAQ